ncbi:MAG: M14 family metallopeptidase [Fimbriimonadaceae bacterium]|nr:M14 family metallopeptidase [Fimbriimonadaceae bacterium]
MKRSALLLLVVLASLAQAQTSPKAEFGHALGDDYFLANYQQLERYWKKLDRESPRFKLESIGKTEEGREQYMAIVTDPSNMSRLARYKEIARKLARAEGVDESEAKALAAEGKAVVWIDGGLHASEVLCAQALMEMGWQLVSRDDEETRRVLRDCIILLVHANPDGHDLVADWYMRNPDPSKRSLSGLPRLYQKYIGHDNNRDFFASTQSETKNMNRVMYSEWYPEIVYNHHQTGPAGTVMFSPPFRDPFAYECDPLVRTGLDFVSSAMHDRFLAEDKPGVTMRSGATYSGWWNGGLRTMAYFHNMIGILTETIGSPTPTRIPFVKSKLLPSQDLPAPIEPQEWHFRQSVDYSITANYAILDYASRYREELLLNFWKMGRNSIEKGRTDTWTPNPRRIEEARSFADLRKPADRDPRAFLIPGDQADYATAVKFVNTLMETGLEVRRSAGSFSYKGKTYPAGTFVVRADQAFRPHVLSMFEPQVHPDDFEYPGAPPTAPYDNAGWTLAYTMGVQFDRTLDAFDQPLDLLRTPAKPTVPCDLRSDSAGYVIDPRVNDAFLAMNRMMNDGVDVYRMAGTQVSAEAPVPLGAFWVPATERTRQLLEGLAREKGVRASNAGSKPSSGLVRLRQPRIALLDRYGGSMPSGWTRWVLEQFEFPFTVVYPPEIDRGDLSKFDVLVMVDGMTIGGRGRGGGGETLEGVPDEWRVRQGSLSVDESLPRVREFVERGGTVVAIGSATGIAQQLGLPVANALVETQNGLERPVSREKFYVPGSVLRVRLDPSHPLAFGMPEQVDVMFDASPSFRLTGDADRIAWYDTDHPLRSGWAWGQERLENTVAAVATKLGKGRVVLYGPEILFRGQPHGTFKLLFNALLLGQEQP